MTLTHPMLRSGPRRWSHCLAAAVLALVAHASLAQELPAARPEELGLSSERLSRIGDWIRAEVAAGRVPGAVVMVARNGRLAYYEAIGRQAAAAPGAMRKDSLFRIYSMTKPLVSVAALMLVEEGKLLLEAPVSRYIPSFLPCLKGQNLPSSSSISSGFFSASATHSSIAGKAVMR